MRDLTKYPVTKYECIVCLSKLYLRELDNRKELVPGDMTLTILQTLLATISQLDDNQIVDVLKEK